MPPVPSCGSEGWAQPGTPQGKGCAGRWDTRALQRPCRGSMGTSGASSLCRAASTLHACPRPRVHTRGCAGPGPAGSCLPLPLSDTLFVPQQTSLRGGRLVPKSLFKGKGGSQTLDQGPIFFTMGTGFSMALKNHGGAGAWGSHSCGHPAHPAGPHPPAPWLQPSEHWGLGDSKIQVSSCDREDTGVCGGPGQPTGKPSLTAPWGP